MLCVFFVCFMYFMKWKIYNKVSGKLSIISDDVWLSFWGKVKHFFNELLYGVCGKWCSRRWICLLMSVQLKYSEKSRNFRFYSLLPRWFKVNFTLEFPFRIRCGTFKIHLKSWNIDEGWFRFIENRENLSFKTFFSPLINFKKNYGFVSLLKQNFAILVEFSSIFNGFKSILPT